MRTAMTMLTLFLALLLSACGSIKGQFVNRAACSLDREEAYFCSFYGPLCVGAKIDERDAKAMCKVKP